MTTQYGVPLTGAQMKALRAAGLPDGTDVRYCGEDFLVEELLLSHDGYYLPADHHAYTLLNARWLDGRNVRLWFGGDEAPSDWDGGNVLCDAGFLEASPPNLDWAHGKDGIAPIIAYIAKVEVMESDEPDTVTIARMTEAEARAFATRIGGRDDRMYVFEVLSKLGLIKPEPTREERFWALHEPEGTTVPPHVKKWVKDALEFER